MAAPWCSTLGQDQSLFLSRRRIEGLIRSETCEGDVADALESFTNVFLHTLLRRRKRDGQLTRTECALLRKIEDADLRYMVHNRISLRHDLIGKWAITSLKNGVQWTPYRKKSADMVEFWYAAQNPAKEHFPTSRRYLPNKSVTSPHWNAETKPKSIRPCSFG
ncbi:hypothetical protein BD413DRAFT_611687 [Trametes elegans]|nr:hypothetical protein BD413DRAFT_611687 [Trametes elegans]